MYLDKDTVMTDLLTNVEKISISKWPVHSAPSLSLNRKLRFVKDRSLGSGLRVKGRTSYAPPFQARRGVQYRHFGLVFDFVAGERTGHPAVPSWHDLRKNRTPIEIWRRK